jgi:hypothetical protein
VNVSGKLIAAEAVNPPAITQTFGVVRDSFPTIALFRCSRQLNPA